MFYKRAQVLVILEKWFCIFIVKISQQVWGHLAKFFLIIQMTNNSVLYFLLDLPCLPKFYTVFKWVNLFCLFDTNFILKSFSIYTHLEFWQIHKQLHHVKTLYEVLCFTFISWAIAQSIKIKFAI